MSRIYLQKEMAANALVRCCFHAYADSSYARAAGGTEGSVRDSTRATVEDEQEEDVYDGDENHKVWAGSQEQLDEGPYDLYGTGSRVKTPRPRQVSRPAPVPPPPPPPAVISSNNTNGNTNTSKKPGKKQQQQQQQMMQQPNNHHQNHHRRTNGNGHHMMIMREDGARTLGPPPNRPWIVNPGLAYAATLPPPRMRPQYATVEPRPLRAARSLAALDGPHLLGGSSGRRGHLNERAFSYSIRQEHRARSHASLASLKFAAPPDVENGREELKKEREILQLVAGLGLGGDDLERREVPPGLYRLPR